MNVKDKLREAINDLDPSKYYNQNRRIYNNYFGENNLKNLPNFYEIVEIPIDNKNTNYYNLISGKIERRNGNDVYEIKEVVKQYTLEKIGEILFERLEKLRIKKEKDFFENGKTDI